MQATIAFPVVDKENISNVASKKNPRKRTITVDGGTAATSLMTEDAADAPFYRGYRSFEGI